MKRIGLVMGLALFGFACAESVGQMLEDAGTMLQDGSVPDAGAQTFQVDCSKAVNGFVLTDVDQQDFGQVIIRQTFPDPWGVTDPPRNVDFQTEAFWSIGGKVLVQCSGNVISASIEVR